METTGADWQHKGTVWRIAIVEDRGIPRYWMGTCDAPSATTVGHSETDLKENIAALIEDFALYPDDYIAA